MVDQENPFWNTFFRYVFEWNVGLLKIFQVDS